MKKHAKTLSSMTLCGNPLNAFFLATEKFHGNRIPEILVGGIMVDWALELLDLKENIMAISETKWALPDVIQLFTPCTLGNRRLVVLGWGKMGLSLFSQKKYAGYRIWLDLTKTKHFPSIYNWHMRLTPPLPTPDDQLLTDILTAGRSILSSRSIPITRLVDISHQSTMAVCSQCNEAYPEEQGDLCLSCQGNSYYEIVKNDAVLH